MVIMNNVIEANVEKESKTSEGGNMKKILTMTFLVACAVTAMVLPVLACGGGGN
jgi:hypothetical protein